MVFMREINKVKIDEFAFDISLYPFIYTEWNKNWSFLRKTLKLNDQWSNLQKVFLVGFLAWNKKIPKSQHSALTATP